MIVNNGGVTVSLNLTANGIIVIYPSAGMHGEYLSWDSEGAQITPGNSITATLIYQYNIPMEIGNNVERTFDVIITATEVQ